MLPMIRPVSAMAIRIAWMTFVPIPSALSKSQDIRYPKSVTKLFLSPRVRADARLWDPVAAPSALSDPGGPYDLLV
jgi:hypothetical protein